jgi:hypothetical protein
MRPLIEVDANVEWSQLNTHLVELISKMAPFGKDNPSPVFVLENATVMAQRLLGAEGKHLKVILQGKDPKAPIDGLFWNAGQTEKLQAHTTYHFVVVPELNTFNNVTKVQLIIQDYQLAGNAAATRQEANQPAPFYTSALVEPVALNPNLPPMPNAKPAADKPTAPAPVAEDGTVNWIDHRSRDGIETFVGQLMLPLQDSRDVILYHEGRPPNIPFLSENLLCNRDAVRKAQELILWDLPPDLPTLHQVLRTVQPGVVHLVGGKYQTVPVFPVARDYLKVIYQAIPRLAQKDESGAFYVITTSHLASQLASTRTVVYQGLLLLVKTGLITVSVEPESDERVRIEVKPPSAAIADNQITQSIEWLAFQHGLAEVGRFRDWLLSSPLALIKSSAIVETDSRSVLDKGDPNHGQSSGTAAFQKR